MKDEIEVHCSCREMVDVTTLKPHPRNPNKHSEEQIALLAKNIRALGWRHPVIVSERSGYIVAGHARVLAAGVLGVTQVPVDRQVFASEQSELSYLIADNRIAELAERDNATIKDLLETLDDGSNDMDLTGYTAESIEELMTQVHVEDDNAKLQNINEQYVVMITCRDELHQSELLDRFISEGLTCKALQS